MLKKIFITGLTVLIPLVITIYVIGGLFYFADGILGQRINEYVYSNIGYQIPGLGILIVILLIFALGLLIHLSKIKFFRWMRKGVLGLFFSNFKFIFCLWFF